MQLSAQPMLTRILTTCFVLLYSSGLAFAQNNPKPANGLSLEDDPVFKAWKGEDNADDVYDIAYCGNCHFGNENPFSRRRKDFCELDELKTWLEKDKHAICRQRVVPLNLTQVKLERAKLRETLPKDMVKLDEFIRDWVGESNIVSWSICEKMKIDVATPEGYTSFRDNCLSCHGGYEPNDKSKKDFEQENKKHPGIDCNYCHQLGDNNSWARDHHNTVTWRTKPPAEKSQAGMRDLVNVVERAQLCASCHIGDHSKGRFVTHEMYVAGHPPLPAFELQQFVSLMPPHWRSERKTYERLEAYKDRDKYFAENFGKVRPDQHAWEAQALLVGAIESSRRSAALIAEAEQHKHWGDFALYDCSACHHELRLPSPRQQRSTGEIPGRPRLIEWQSPLLAAALAVAPSPNAVMSARDELNKSVNAVPFGSNVETTRAAQRLLGELEKVETWLRSKPMGVADCKQTLQALASVDSSRLLDYHSGRQVVWGMQLLERELGLLGSPLPQPLTQKIQKLGGSPGNEFMQVRLPSEREGNLYDDPSLQGFLAKELEYMQRYNPANLEQGLKEIQLQVR